MERDTCYGNFMVKLIWRLFDISDLPCFLNENLRHIT